MPFTPHMHQYQHVPKCQTALYYITWLSLANPSNIGPKPCNAYKLHWKKVNFYSVLTVINALLTKAFQTTYTPVPARTKILNRFILHYLVVSSQPVKHRPQTMQCI